MADTTTTAYSFTKPEVGASEDTWGTKLNTNWDDLDTIANAIGGKTAAGTMSYANVAKFVTTATGVTVTGLTTTTDLTATGATTLAGASTTADITFGDNDKAIFGAGSDLQIYHDASDSWIVDNGTGGLKIGVSGTGTSGFYKGTGAEAIATFEPDGPVTLYNNNAIKLATTATGIDVTGTVTADGLAVGASNPEIEITNTGQRAYSLNVIGSSFYLKDKSDSQNIIKVDEGGDISFYEDTGTTAKFFWDASAESLGIGTSPSKELHVKNVGSNAVGGSQILIEGGTGGYGAGVSFQSPLTGGSLAEMARITADGESSWNTTASTQDAGLRFYTSLDGTVAERMRIDSSGNVGIGTSSPSVRAEISGTDAAVSLRVNTANSGVSASNYSQIQLSDNDAVRSYWRNLRDGSGATHFAYGDHLAFLSDAGGTPTERMRIDSSGNVKINNGNLQIERSGSSPLLQFTDTGVNSRWMGLVDGTSNFTIYGTNGSTQELTLDSSGNLLVGGTTYEGSTTSSASSAYIAATGFISANVTNDFGMQVNRTGTDGALFNFRKNGADVGSIGTEGGYTKIISGNGTFGSGLSFFNLAISPRSAADADADGTVNLGAPSVRFKDLYLSGGVVFGDAGGSGTSSSNSLDSYEEGTWTAGFAFTGASVDIAYGSQTGFYTKVGNLVTVQCNMRLTSKGSSAGAARITGLPFPVQNTTGAQPAGNLHFSNILITGMVTAYSDLNQTTMNLRKISDAGANDSLKDTDCADDTNVIMTMSYRV
jgi:hypothetical protein